jgi:hypothetical protein
MTVYIYCNKIYMLQTQFDPFTTPLFIYKLLSIFVYDKFVCL